MGADAHRIGVERVTKRVDIDLASADPDHRLEARPAVATHRHQVADRQRLDRALAMRRRDAYAAHEARELDLQRAGRARQQQRTGAGDVVADNEGSGGELEAADRAGLVRAAVERHGAVGADRIAGDRGAGHVVVNDRVAGGESIDGDAAEHVERQPARFDHVAAAAGAEIDGAAGEHRQQRVVGVEGTALLDVGLHRAERGDGTADRDCAADRVQGGHAQHRADHGLDIRLAAGRGDGDVAQRRDADPGEIQADRDLGDGSRGDGRTGIAAQAEERVPLQRV